MPRDPDVLQTTAHLLPEPFGVKSASGFGTGFGTDGFGFSAASVGAGTIDLPEARTFSSNARMSNDKYIYLSSFVAGFGFSLATVNCGSWTSKSRERRGARKGRGISEKNLEPVVDAGSSKCNTEPPMPALARVGREHSCVGRLGGVARTIFLLIAIAHRGLRSNSVLFLTSFLGEPPGGANVVQSTGRLQWLKPDSESSGGRRVGRSYIFTVFYKSTGS